MYLASSALPCLSQDSPPDFVKPNQTGVQVWPLFDDHGKRIFAKDRLNNRNSQANKNKLRLSIRRQSLVVRVRADPWSRFLKQRTLPMQLGTWGNTLEAASEEVELNISNGRTNELLHQLEKTGFEKNVICLNGHIPNLIFQWLITYDNTFNDGMSDSYVEWVLLVTRLEETCELFLRAELKLLPSGATQSAWRSAMAEWYQKNVPDRHKIRDHVRSWHFLHHIFIPHKLLVKHGLDSEFKDWFDSLVDTIGIDNSVKPDVLLASITLPIRMQ